MISSESSNCFWEIKAFAILSVFYAHLVWYGNSVTGAVVYESIGCLGVPLFMLMAGYFDAKSKTPFSIRIKKLFIPLLIWGTLTFILKIILDQTYISSSLALDFFKWIYGCGSWYYFIPVLFWCIVLSKYINCYVLFVVGLVSMLLSYLDIIPYNEYFTPYTNPLNYCIYFVIGNEYRKRFGDNISIKPVITILAFIVVLLFLFVFKIPYYWNPLTPIYTLGVFIILWLFFHRIPIYNCIVKVGKLSMVMYLCHLQIAQALASRICSLISNEFIGNIIKVPIVFLIVIALVYTLEWLLSKMKFTKALLWLGFK